MTDLASYAPYFSPPPGATTCTSAVVYWMWCLENRNTNPVNFIGFLNALPVARRTDVFLKNMAKAKGGRIIWKRTKVLWRGAVVIWTTNAQAAAHAGVNVGNNLICGYNQRGNFFNNNACVDPQGTRCSHKFNLINTTDYDVYTVGPNDAEKYFHKHQNNVSKW